MRVFLAVTLSDAVKAALAAAARRLAPAASGADVKWCDAGQFHLTLAFLGEVAPAILPHVASAADRVCAPLPPFVCRAHGFGFFGTRRNPKTLWAGIEPSPELDALRERLWAELKRFGFKDEEKEWRPHVALGRCRESANNRAVVDAMDADEDCAFGTWEVARVTLYESRLSPRGALYRALGRSPLLG